MSHDRYFMDRVVDHMLIFKGDGVIDDFPGNYSEYREWKSLKEAEDQKERTNQKKETGTSKPNTWGGEKKRKLSYKEKQEMQQLEQDILHLETEKTELETALCSGEISIDELNAKSKRLPAVCKELDDKSMRWLELSEIEG